MQEEKMTFKVKGQDGKEVECEVLFTFESEETKKNYMVYTDNTVDEEGNTKVYASIYTPNTKTKSIIRLRKYLYITNVIFQIIV